MFEMHGSSLACGLLLKLQAGRHHHKIYENVVAIRGMGQA